MCMQPKVIEDNQMGYTYGQSHNLNLYSCNIIAASGETMRPCQCEATESMNLSAIKCFH